MNRTEDTPQGSQVLLPDVAPISTRDRIEARGRKPMKGGSAPPPRGGLFDTDAQAQADIFDRSALGAFRMGFTPYDHLPNFARIAIERLDADSTQRTGPKLDFLLAAYAGNNGAELDDHTRESAHHICRRRFGDTFTD